MAIMIREPENSWEVSFVFYYKRPHIRLDLPRGLVWKLLLGSERVQELKDWAATAECDGYWFKNHSLPE